MLYRLAAPRHLLMHAVPWNAVPTPAATRPRTTTPPASRKCWQTSRGGPPQSSRLERASPEAQANSGSPAWLSTVVPVNTLRHQ